MMYGSDGCYCTFPQPTPTYIVGTKESIIKVMHEKLFPINNECMAIKCMPTTSCIEIILHIVGTKYGRTEEINCPK